LFLEHEDPIKAHQLQNNIINMVPSYQLNQYGLRIFTLKESNNIK